MSRSENVTDVNTKPADSRSLEFCRSKMGVTEIPKQFRDAVLTIFLSLCPRSWSRVELQSSIFKQTWRVTIPTARMSSDFSLIVRSPSGDANIFRWLCCFTSLMNLHDFVTESFNPVHIFRDARTVSFCLNTDHILTCLMMFSARFKTAQFWSVLDTWWIGSVVSLLISDVGMRGMKYRQYPWSAETFQLPWSTMESLVAACVESHGVLVWSTDTENWYDEVCVEIWQSPRVPWRARVETWQLPWSPMDSVVWILDILMEYHEKS